MTNSLLPDLIEIQHSSFRWFLEEGSDRRTQQFFADYRLYWQIGVTLFRKKLQAQRTEILRR